MTDKFYRYSSQRARVLEILKNTDTHPTADWVYETLKKEFPKLSLGTVYRNIGILIEQGLVKRIQSGSTFDRFEANTTAHYHLICEKCGKIMDFKMTEKNELEKQASLETDFEIHGHRVDFFGLCSQCARKK